MKKEMVACIFAGILGGALTFTFCKKIAPEKSNEASKAYKFKSYYNMLNQWLELRNNGKKLEQFFVKNGYKKIAIYGMGEMGSRLVEELKSSSVEVDYGIDKDGGSPFDEIPVYSLDDELDLGVDAVIVTAVFAFDTIEAELSTRFDCPIISLEDVVIGA